MLSQFIQSFDSSLLYFADMDAVSSREDVGIS